MILLVCIALGLAARLATGRSLATLSTVRLRGESILLSMLVVQIVTPSLALSEPWARIAFIVWAATFPAMLGIVWVNRHEPGMTVLGMGLLLNMVVIYANGGMPVSPVAVAVVKSGVSARIPQGDFVHVLAGAGTLFPWLADILPLPGPDWIRSVASPGDCLLAGGIAAFLACSGKQSRPLQS